MSQPPFGKRVVSSQNNMDGVRVGPSASFNPAMIDSIEGIDDTTRGYVSAARDAIEVGEKGLNDLWDGMRPLPPTRHGATTRS